ncbi:MAG: hypothetical protein ACI841_002055, partial [Planctomycetota bacterium]
RNAETRENIERRLQSGEIGIRSHQESDFHGCLLPT